MDISPGLPATDNFQHWPPWRPLVVETAKRVLDYTGGTLVMPMTVAGDHPIPSPFRLNYLEPYAEAARTWLHAEAEVIDTTHLTPSQAAQQIADALRN